MRNALLFQDAETFWDFLRLHGSDSQNNRGYTLYLTKPTGKHAKPLLLLLGFMRKRSLLGELTSLFGEKPPQVEEHETHLRLHIPGQLARDVEIAQRRDGTDLMSLVELVPVRHLEAPHKHVLFWLKDQALVGSLIELCMRLQNDRIQFAPLSSKKEQGVLVRIESPSFYLLQLFREQHAEQATIFTEEAPDFYTEWGFQHPLIDLWRYSDAPRDGRWIFVQREGTPQVMEPVQWQDAYKAAEFVLTLETEESWREDRDRDVRFSLPLRFEPKTRHADAEIWLLEEQHRPQLERLLSLMDEEDLDLLLINIQKDAKGRHRFFIREKQRGKGRIFLDFGGTRFASYKGIHHLLLPVELELQPQLRRDQYTHLFHLQSGVLTFVSVPDASQHPTMDQASLLRVQEDAFAPLRQYIDYLVTQQSEKLEEIKQNSIFDLGRYARAPYRPDLLTAKRAANPVQQSEHNIENRPNPVEEQAKKEGEEVVVISRQQKLTKPSEKAEKRALSELEEEERSLEIEVIQDPKRQTFLELAALKDEMGKPTDARDCLTEALWLQRASKDEADLKRTFGRMVRASQAKAKRKSKDPHPPEATSDQEEFLLFLFLGKRDTPHEQALWLRTCSQWLHQNEVLLRKKLRWLAWRELLQQNQDQRELARVREAILQDLNQHGLSLIDLPIFIQNRLLQSRHLLDEKTSPETQGDFHLALHHLNYLYERFRQLKLPPLQIVGQALVAVGYVQVGSIDQGLAVLQNCFELAQDDNELDAWVTYVASSVSLKCGEIFHKQVETKRQVHAKAFKKDDSLRNKLEELGHLLRSDEDKELEEAFSASNLRRLYTDSPIQNQQLEKAFDQVLQAHEKNKVADAEKNVEKMLGLLHDAIRGEGDFAKSNVDYNEIAKTISRLIDVLAKLRWTGAGNSILNHFVRFVEQTPATPPKNMTSMMGLFFMLMRLHMAQGLVVFEKLAPAQKIITESLTWLFQSIDYPIDFLDFCGVALQAVEGIPLHERTHIVEEICGNFSTQINDPKSTSRVHYEGSALRRLAFLLQLQLVRVAISKEKLALGLMKQFMDRDEMLIRERILTEDITRSHGE
ncbi:MAG: hypothetical protein H6728_05970 [Myxococcales bacterium]|nr:hypothetical protein [Myxococcales bacterium]